MFDSRLRDKLLFEDKDFTYSRRYFWAYNTLGVINDGIKSMRSAYIDTFTKDFWAGRHPTLWPHPCPDTAEGRLYNDRMEVVRHELESAVGDLAEMYEKNEKTRTEIRSLREQLFSGSSVKESRRAIEQGDNIKILTGVSMIFLPLTFVTVSPPPFCQYPTARGLY
jgi:Mg2+ and Co2+ transporter CorA